MFDCTYIPYRLTNKFSKIVLDYVSKAPNLQPFFEYEVSMEGVLNAINARKEYKTDRKLLTTQLIKQYEALNPSGRVQENLQKLQSDNTFTICTAHQPNIFTGHLYFIYKILHVIKLANTFKTKLPEYNFVPVFFMGSEDADLQELNHVVIDGKKYDWDTKQKGAVGRMIIDDQFISIMNEFEGVLAVKPHGKEITDLARSCYRKGTTIQQSTFLFVHELFKEFGLIVLLPDEAAWKKPMISIFRDDILHHTAGKIAKETSTRLEKHYKAQAYPRDINLFYLKDDIRNRIEQIKDNYVVDDTEIVFTREEILQELNEHPERFSPNVILRGLFQEVILPDIAFVGGGGELAYWLQLKDVFHHYRTPFPMLVLRNSFLIVKEKWQELLEKLGIEVSALFRDEESVFEEWVKLHSDNNWQLQTERADVKDLYEKILDKAKKIDPGLERHIHALETKTTKKIDVLEKKLLRSQKRKFEAAERQLSKVYSHLFPENGLQERTDNFMGFYALWGAELLAQIYDASKGLDQEFTILREK